MKDPKEVAKGKKSKASGGEFERRVRKDLEEKGWVCDRWTNNVEFLLSNLKLNDNFINHLHGIPEEVRYKSPSFNVGGHIVPAKPKYVYNPLLKRRVPLMRSAGFPDFIAFKCDHSKVPYCDKNNNCPHTELEHIGDKQAHCLQCDGVVETDRIHDKYYELIGVECKIGKYLDQEEKSKCRWLLENNVFSKILIAYRTKEKNRIKVNYMDFEEYDKR